MSHRVLLRQSTHVELHAGLTRADEGALQERLAHGAPHLGLRQQLADGHLLRALQHVLRRVQPGLLRAHPSHVVIEGLKTCMHASGALHGRPSRPQTPPLSRAVTHSSLSGECKSGYAQDAVCCITAEI